MKFRSLGVGLLLCLASSAVWAQLTDRTLAPNAAGAGIAKSLEDQTGPGRADVMTWNSSLFNINRDPFRAVRRGRQLFQRKFTRAQGQGGNEGDGAGDISTNSAIGAGLADSCSACHGRPKGSAGSGGDNATRPDSRDAPHLFGLGLKEMLADEITTDLRNIRQQAIINATRRGRPLTVTLKSKGIHFGSITVSPGGAVDYSQIEGIEPDLRIKPFFAEGSTISMREFIVGALHKEVGLEVNDPDLASAHSGNRVVTPSGMVLDGTQDKIDAPPAPDAQTGQYEIDPAIVDYLEFYLLNYFKAGLGKQDSTTALGRVLFNQIGCNQCHVANLQIDHDRRVADLDTKYDRVNGIFNSMFSTATPLINVVDDGSGLPTLKQPQGNAFLVKNIYTDFKRHDLGPSFYERNYDGTVQKVFLTRPLWGVGSTGPYGHDGRSVTLDDVILRHGGESQASRNAYARLSGTESEAVLKFLNSLILFPPDDTASTLDPGVRTTPNFPQFGHGSIKLTVLFNDPTDPE
jgi:mono/diheme cytochrome c family protein